MCVGCSDYFRHFLITPAALCSPYNDTNVVAIVGEIFGSLIVEANLGLPGFNRMSLKYQYEATWQRASAANQIGCEIDFE